MKIILQLSFKVLYKFVIYIIPQTDH